MKILYPYLFLFTLCFGFYPSFGQVDYTAQDKILPYNGHFGYGVNPGYYPGWLDEQLGSISAGDPKQQVEGVGANTFRPALFEHFLEQYGYDTRVKTFQHYHDLGMRDLTVFIGYPSKEHRDTEHYCPTYQSETFANLYTDIWDGGANGTPYNDDNYFARYVYKTVSLYKDYVKFWEIWNEPDFDHSNNAWKNENIPGNWWHNDPDPCDYALRAPPTQYVRMLRIAYEVIKTVDPDSYVAVGGMGFPSFLNYIMNHTDNPDEGKVSPKYPLKGGAYFEIMSYHSYPHIDGSMRTWSNETAGFVYSRHSDAAVDGVIRLQNEFRAVLEKAGFDGKKYPAKEYIITECNLPRKVFQDFIGTEESQLNFIIKALVTAQQHDVHQFHVYNLGELADPEEATAEFQLMGLFENLYKVKPFQQKRTNLGYTYKTISDLLADKKYGKQLTNALNLTPNIRGAAFESDTEITCVLWAKTTKDQSEQASANYSFPTAFNVQQLKVANWDFSKTKNSKTLNTNSIALSGEPVFLSFPKKFQKKKMVQLPWQCQLNPYSQNIDISFDLNNTANARLEIFDSKGKLLFQKYGGKSLSKGTYQNTFNVAKETDNIFICSLEMGEKVYIQRLIRTQ